MLSSLLIVAIALHAAGPLTPEEVAVRQARIQEIYEIGASRAPADIARLMDVIRTVATDWERVAGLQALAPHHRAAAHSIVTTLASHTDTAIRVEATIKLHVFDPSKENAALLAALRPLGATLRRAFRTGDDRGRPLYLPAAAAFFRESAKHPLVFTRLDGAMGLVEIGGPHLAEGVAVLETVLSSTDPTDRLLALRHFKVSYDEPALQLLVVQAADDPDARVAGAARAMLASD